MNTVRRFPGLALLLTLATVMAAAQDAAPPGAPTASKAAPASKSTAQIDAGEPRATISPTEPASATPPPATDAAATPHSAPRNRGAKVAGQKAPGGSDRLDLGTATVTGDREQPKVMYIVPWKKSDIGDLSGKPMNSLLDEALAPVDREEFRREVAYYDAIRADAPQNGASPPASQQGEK